MAKQTQPGRGREAGLWIALLAALAFLAYLVFGKGRALSVDSRIVYPPDELTGAPVFDSHSNHFPRSPYVFPVPRATGAPLCPSGYLLWRDIRTGYQCALETNFPKA